MLMWIWDFKANYKSLVFTLEQEFKIEGNTCKILTNKGRVNPTRHRDEAALQLCVSSCKDVIHLPVWNMGASFSDLLSPRKMSGTWQGQDLHVSKP